MFKRNRRGRRLKHYRRSFYSGWQRFKSAALAVCAAALVFGVGWFAGPHILNWGAGLWYGMVHPQPSSGSQSQPDPAPQQPGSEPASSVPQQPENTALPEDQQPTSAIVEGSWTVVSLSALSSPEAIEAAAAGAAADGAQYAMITLKDASGYVYYPSTVPAAAGSIAAATVDPAAIAAAFKAAGVTPVACLSAFRDPIAAYTDRSMGIHYADSDYMWLDNAADAGGKPWLNPYSDGAVQFVGDLIQEVSALGYDHVLLSAVQFPAYVSAKQDFGDTGGLGRADALRNAVAAWGSRFEGTVTLWYEYGYADCQTVSTALDALPCALGVQNLVMQAPAFSEGTEPPAEEELDGVVQAMKDGGCAYVVLHSGSTGEFR